MKIFRELLQLLGLVIAFVGFIACITDCYEMATQIKTLVCGAITFFVGIGIIYIGYQLPESVKK